MKKILGFSEYMKESSVQKIEESEKIFDAPIFEDDEKKIDLSDFVKKFSGRLESIGKEAEKEAEKIKKQSEWEGISTGFKDKSEGDLFRKWMSEKHSDWKGSGGDTLSPSSKFYDNGLIREAYGKYKEEYGFSQKESEDFRKWWRSDEDRKKKEFEVENSEGKKSKDSVGDKGSSTAKVLLLAYKSEKSKWDEEWKKNNKKEVQSK
jgi:hypothetical protein